MATWYCASNKWTAVTPWAASTAYSVGDIRRQLATPTVGNERVWRCTTAGTSGGSEPSWTLTKASTTNDNTVVWTEITGNSTYNTNPANMVAPHARFENAVSWMAAGDTLYIGNHHTQTTASTVTFTLPGTSASPNYIYVVDDTNSTPTISSGATIITTAAASQTYNGSFYFEAAPGGGFVISSGSGAQSTSITLCSGTNNTQSWYGCDFILAGTSGGNINLGSSSTVTELVHNYCRYKFAAASQKIAVRAHVKIINSSIISGTTTPTVLVQGTATNAGTKVLIDGLDLTNLSTSFDLTSGTNGIGAGDITFRCCKLPSGWAGNLTTSDITVPGSNIIMHAVDDADIMYREQLSNYCGKYINETATFTRTGGATVTNSKSSGTDPQPFSFKFSPNSNCAYPLGVLKTDFIPVFDLITNQSAVGVPITLTAHALCDQVTALTNKDFWMEVSYPGTAGSTLYTTVSSAPASNLTAATNLSAGYGWTTTGMTNPQQVIATVTFTPQEIGVILVTLCVGNSTPATIYIDPKIA